MHSKHIVDIYKNTLLKKIVRKNETYGDSVLQIIADPSYNC